MGRTTSVRVSEVLSTYLPELSSDEIRDRLHGKLLREHGGAGVAESRHGAPAAPPPYDPAADVEGRFRDYCSYLARVWAADLPEAVACSPVVSARATIVRDFADAQARVVSGYLTRTLLEELHRRRSRHLLAGDTPEERYRSFREWTNSPAGHAELVTRYPTLFADTRDRVRSAAAYLTHILRAVERHRERLGSHIPGISAHARVATVLMGEGDAHNGGRSVARIVLDDGSQVLYKPRPLDAEAGYNAVVAWLNTAMGSRLRTVSVLPCGDSGFVEHVPTEPVAVGAEEYFAQIGQLAGILYLLKATDIHYENVVTCATGPVVIDAETLLTPRLRAGRSDDGGSAWNVAVRRLQNSVAGIGILPMVMKSSKNDPGMDVGVIGYDLGQQIPYKLLQVRNPGRDDMFVELAQMETSELSANLSVSRSAEIPVRAQRDIVKREFRRVLDFARSRADEVMSVIDAHLGDVRFRYLHNATYFYSQLLRMATHPDAVTDPLVKAAVLNRVVLRTGDVHEIADEEARQLAAGDVPYFSYTARSRALTSADRLVLDDAFEERPLDTVHDRVTGLTAETVEWELRMIDLAFVNKLPVDREQTRFVPVARDGRRVPVDRARLLKEAVRIGDALVAGMIEDPGGGHPATWIAPQITTVEQSQWSPGTLGYDLYAGSPGIALVLAGLSRETGEARYGEAALRVINPLENQLRGELLKELAISPGGLEGLAGTVYAIVTARRLLNLTDGVAAGQLAGGLAHSLGADAGIDHLGGMAGALAVCLALHRHTGDEGERALVEEAARAVAAAELAELSRAVLPSGRVTRYTGYAHGAMGIGPALLEYGTVFDDPAARDVGLRVIGAAVDAYDPVDGDWPREWDTPLRSYAWCHGAPGMLLGALAARRHAPSSIPDRHLARLAELTLAKGFGNNPTYCHGDLGSAEIVAMARRDVPGLFDDEIVGDLYPRLFLDVVERYEERADTKYAYSNSLMLGQAGFAWSILRYLAPSVYPSVLSFE
ncbi:type 2 lanthipeptide synthetase LanM family protein [Microbispora rosea]|uniref:type 2 lanthipeptide synthetase LanM family protein n=1 Tax=Microbispora rosea TaxID=58117 RepID=UPI00341395C9